MKLKSSNDVKDKNRTFKTVKKITRTCLKSSYHFQNSLNTENNQKNVKPNFYNQKLFILYSQ